MDKAVRNIFKQIKLEAVRTSDLVEGLVAISDFCNWRDVEKAILLERQRLKKEVAKAIDDTSLGLFRHKETNRNVIAVTQIGNSHFVFNGKYFALVEEPDMELDYLKTALAQIFEEDSS